MRDVEPKDEEARAISNVRARYADGSHRWRTPTATLLNVGLVGLLAGLPALPGGAGLTGVPLGVSLIAFGVVACASVSAAIAHAVAGVWSTAYKVFTTLESASWCAANVALVGWSGSARSVYWMSLGALVVVTATTVRRHTVLLCVLGGSLAGLVAWFVWQGHLADALLAGVLGTALLWFQRLSTTSGWAAERDRARAELLAERLRDQERARIARDLHDGVAAELTAALWQAQALDGENAAEVRGVVERLRATLADLRRVVRGAQGVAISARALADLCDQAGEAIVAAHGEARWTFDAQLEAPAAALAPSAREHLVRVVQEAVLNALRHGRARQVTGALSVGAGVVLTVEDDGVGCPSERLGRGGTGNIAQRAAELGGTAEWAARAGGGTRLTLRFEP